MLLVLDDGEFYARPTEGIPTARELTSTALSKMKGSSSAVEALCGQPKSRISSTSSSTKRLTNEVPPPMLQVLDDGEFFRLALPREYLSRER
jgi:hypothetical protein